MLQVLHELWDFVIGGRGHPCPTDTFLVKWIFRGESNCQLIPQSTRFNDC